MLSDMDQRLMVGRYGDFFCLFLSSYDVQNLTLVFISGWWFDHASFGNIPLLHDICKKANPKTILAFNYGKLGELHNSNPDYEDYTYGHPSERIFFCLSFSIIYLPHRTQQQSQTFSF